MGKRIMIVEDSMRWRLELRDLLLSSGFSVVGEFSNGRTAIEQYDRLRPDLVMIDAQMPEMDGVVTMKELRYKYPDAVMVLCAGTGEKSSVVEAMSAGAVDFVAKPYVSRRVIDVLRHALAGIRH